VKDRGFVYQPNTIKDNKPTAIGHQYSFVVLLPEHDKEKIGNWVILLATKRVGSQKIKEMVGVEQVAAILIVRGKRFFPPGCKAKPAKRSLE